MVYLISGCANASSNHPKPKSPFNIASGVWWCKTRGMKVVHVALLAFSLCLPAAQAATFEAKVVGISDGDTVTVVAAVNNLQYKIRLDGIDAPESGQAFGDKAKQALSAKVFGKQVLVYWEKIDNYQRVLGHLTIGQRWINHEMAAEGWVWHYKEYNKDKRLSDAEAKAKAGKKGLWADNTPPLAPWEWRKKKANQPAPIPNRPSSNPAQPAPVRPQPAPRAPTPKQVVVFVTATGKKYHSSGCQYLRKSKIAIALQNARRGYTSCSKCSPPQ